MTKQGFQTVVSTVGHSTRALAGFEGFCRASPKSPSLGWRNASSRGYTDCMQSLEFRENLDDLTKRAGHGRVALMCAEAAAIAP